MFRFAAQRLAPRVKTAVMERTATMADPTSSTPVAATSSDVESVSSKAPANVRAGSVAFGSSPFLPDSRLSVLKNGLTVVSRESVDNIDYVGFFFRAGPAYLHPHERGYGTLLARALQHSNRVLATPSIIKSFAANQCLNSNDVVGRQLIGLTAEGLSEDLDMLLDTFCQMLFVPSFQHWELKESLQWVRDFQYANQIKEDPYSFIVDLAHRAAFGDNGAGGPSLLPPHLHEKFDMNILINLWQRTCNLSNMALVSSSTWLHDTLCDRVAHCEEVLNNENDAPRAEVAPVSFESGTIIDFHNRKNYALTVGLASAFGAMSFAAPPATDAAGSAAVKVLLQHPQLRKLANFPFAQHAVSEYHGYEQAGLVTFVTQGVPSHLANVNREVVGTLEEIARGKATFDVDLARLAARLAEQKTRRSAVESLAVRWAVGVHTDELESVTEADVQKAASQLLAKAPAMVYHGDAGSITRDTLL
eukprot:TRINITY_DN2091_c0_g1_i1.p1 TRINITY_DN2091_c0_g1~~TRINITY_DN2091_c0_g1_i1.p1  ORF type:complete len:475 (+),score=121.88 TRINITY_DN2091_c0_g1_i1:86-1510(+)